MLWVVLAWLGVAFTGGGWSPNSLWGQFTGKLGEFFYRLFSFYLPLAFHAKPIARVLATAAAPSFSAYAGWATFLVPLGFAARMLARAWMRSGGADSVERVRAWVTAHRYVVATVLAIAAGLWGRRVLFHHWLSSLDGATLAGGDEIKLADVLSVTVASALAQFLAMGATLRAFLKPTLDPSEDSRIEISPDEITFDAVAVTREATAAIAAVGALSLALCAWIAVLPLSTLFRDPRIFAAIAGYAGIATVGATYFRFASRVAVGIDGVLVKGTSRTRFYAYKALDDVRVGHTDLELVRRGRVVLRLQLHGADAIRRDAVAERIRTNIERVRQGESAVAAQIVSSSTRDQLARVAAGGADYRGASLSREALWALIEGPAVDATSRRAAAEALARTSDAAERARLRVAADLCADPTVRVALTELADAPAEDEPNPGRRAVAS
jgi:hypothetical protein